jgi:hypothetical protein
VHSSTRVTIGYQVMRIQLERPDIAVRHGNDHGDSRRPIGPIFPLDADGRSWDE